MFPQPAYSITTPRLVLRSAVADDAAAAAQLFSSKQNFPYDSVNPDLTPEIYRERIARWAKSTATGANAFMVIVRRSDDRLIGFGGLNSIETRPALDGNRPLRIADTGVVIDHSCWRQGFALEALCATLEFGFADAGVDRFTMDTSRHNEPWRALMRKLGLGATERRQPCSSWRKDDEWEYLYEVDRESWEAARAALQASGRWPL